MKLHLYILTLLILFSTLFAGEKFYKLTLSSGEKLTEVYLNELVGDSLSVGIGGETRLLAVDDIVAVFVSNKSAVMRNGVLGVVLGGIAGGIIGVATSNTDGEESSVFTSPRAKVLVYSFGGALAGGLLGAFMTSHYDRYDLSNQSKETKIKLFELFLSPGS